MADLAGYGYVSVAHGMKSFENMGVVVSDGAQALQHIFLPTSTFVAGRPSDLFYAPRYSTEAADTGSTSVPSFPYQLVGWVYGTAYNPGAVPVATGMCIPAQEWFVHERGVHVFPGMEMVMDPPAEQWPGQVQGWSQPPLLSLTPLGIAHPRLWTVQVWIDPNGGPPKIGFSYPFGHIPGEPDDISHILDSMFYPAETPEAIAHR
ncbi:hypothetical protein ABZ942_01335 [Nocardia sp. NPDC046473]|uniref:hypothetical protein n=1 Tax=Nocardia sp. NPDC046473 TaxID=3155733 RepID=UPI0033D8BA1E